MLPASRRIFLSWLLLLVPALVIGGAAIALLQREEARLRQQGDEVVAARRAAVATQARLIAENMELFAGDVQTGLLETLAAEPAAGLEEFLARWEATNPLVKVAFRCAPDGRLIRPAAAATGSEAQGFVRRFAGEFASRPPWRSEEKRERADQPKAEADRPGTGAAEQKVALQNVRQTQSARRDLQQLVAPRELAAANLATADYAAASPAAPAARAENRLAETAGAGRPAGLASASVVAVAGLAKPVPEGGRGWRVLPREGRMHVIGWVQPAGGGEVRGVELQLAALVSRLGGTLPTEVGAGEGLALRDAQGRVLHQRGTIPAGATPDLRLPLAAEIFPGWEVAGFLTPTYSRSGGAGLVGLGMLLVGIFVAAIVAGGSLLLWQARRSEAEAAQKTSFVANVSHEFKTPLTTIRLYAELLEQGRVRDAAQGGEYLRTIGRETQRLARLVNNALDFSRLEQGRKQYAREPLDLGAEVARLLDTHAPRIAEAGLTLVRRLPAEPLPVTTDRDALGQIGINLIDNACKYAAAGGELEIAVGLMPAGGAEVRFADRGPGVPAAQRERIFEKFHRVDETLTAEKTGAGLGLSIARQLARGLGGELRCESRPGGGAVFVLTLP